MSFVIGKITLLKSYLQSQSDIMTSEKQFSFRNLRFAFTLNFMRNQCRISSFCQEHTFEDIWFLPIIEQHGEVTNLLNQAKLRDALEKYT